jgi:hypothetical protein
LRILALHQRGTQGFRNVGLRLLSFMTPDLSGFAKIVHTKVGR